MIIIHLTMKQPLVCIYIVKLHSRSSRSIYEAEARWGQPMPSKMHRLLNEILLKF